MITANEIRAADARFTVSAVLRARHHSAVQLVLYACLAGAWPLMWSQGQAFIIIAGASLAQQGSGEVLACPCAALCTRSSLVRMLSTWVKPGETPAHYPVDLRQYARAPSLVEGEKKDFA